MRNNDEGSTRNLRLEKRLAKYLLTLKQGDQLQSTRELAGMFEVSIGSISSTLKYLEEHGAAVIHRRGHLGSFLEHRSPGILWNIIEEGPMVIAQTLPSFPKCEGLATAIYSLLNDYEIETYLIFIRGSYNRIRALKDGRCHAAIMSELAAEALCGEDLKIVLRLPPGSFVTDHRVFYRPTQPGSSKRLRVGLDYESFDIEYLTKLEFAEDEVDFQEMSLMQIDLHLESSLVDAAISNHDHLERLKSSGRLASRPLSPRVQSLIGERDTSAVVITRSDAEAVRIVLEEILDPTEILKIQQKVVDRQMVPRY